MCPCNPNSIVNTISLPTGPSLNPIPGFGVPTVPSSVDAGFKLPVDYPADLTDLFKKISLLIPSGPLKSPLNPNYGKDVMDQVIKVLDQFMPVLMFYKMFLPLLNLITCIIEVLCALPNPFKTANAIKRLFRECIPAFLNLFPIFAIIIMILSVLILVFQLLEFFLATMLKIYDLLKKNIEAMMLAYKDGDARSILAIAQKIGVLLCLIQNLFVVFSMISLIFQIFKDILSLAFGIPPCEDGETSNCCSADVCPQFIKNGNFTRFTGSLQCLSEIKVQAPTMPEILQVVRGQSFQIYDAATAYAGDTNYPFQQFINITDAKDAALADVDPKPVFFPTDSVYGINTPASQASYTVDLRVLYNPSDWGRTLPADGSKRYIRFKDCIVTAPSSKYLINAYNQSSVQETGVLLIVGGKGYEDDGVTPVYGYSTSSNTQLPPSKENIATLNSFFFKAEPIYQYPYVLPDDGYTITDMEYTFKINHPILMQKGIITAACNPTVAIDKNFTAAIANETLNSKIPVMQSFPFPDTAAAQTCIFTATDKLVSNVTLDGLTEMQNSINLCLGQLRSETLAAISQIVPIAFDRYTSSATLTPNVQFTTKSIAISVILKDPSGAILSNSLPADAAANLASSISVVSSFGTVSAFTYDGSSAFNASITSDISGAGTLEISFNNQKLATIIKPADTTSPPVIETNKYSYQFIYTPSAVISPQVGVGDTSDGQPRRDEGDISRDNAGMGES